MRHLIGFSICLLIIFISCNKIDAPVTCECPITSLTCNSPIIGSWKWIYTWYDYYPVPGKNPATPENTGFQETLQLNSNFSWKRIITDSTNESGTFSLGHGSWTPYIGAYIFHYDSIIYCKNCVKDVDYFQISNDTLIFSWGFRGASGSSSKAYKKQVK